MQQRAHIAMIHQDRVPSCEALSDNCNGHIQKGFPGSSLREYIFFLISTVFFSVDL